MKTPSLTLTMALALAASCASAFAEQTTSDGRVIVSPDASGPLQPNTCVAGTEGCTPAARARASLAAASDGMDPTTEGVLVGMGAMPSKETDASVKRAQALFASAALNASKNWSSGDDSGTDYAGIGSKIINPMASAAPAVAPRFSNASASSRLQPSSRGPGGVDATVAAPATFNKATGLSYVRNQKIEAAAGDQGTGLGTLVNDFKSGVSDPKLAGGNEELAPGGTRASDNGGN